MPGTARSGLRVRSCTCLASYQQCCNPFGVCKSTGERTTARFSERVCTSESRSQDPSQKILANRQGRGNHDEGGWCEVRMGAGNLNEWMEEGGHRGSSRAFGP